MTTSRRTSSSSNRAQILMLQGFGNNEVAWARIASRFGRVVLIQMGNIVRVEIWERGNQTYCGPDLPMVQNTSYSLMRLMQSMAIVRLVKKLTHEHFPRGDIDIVIGVSYSNSLFGIQLRRQGRVRRVIMLLCDHLPLKGPIHIRMHRLLARMRSWRASKYSDEVWGVSPRIPALAANPNNFIVPLYVDGNNFPGESRDEIAYIGYPSEDHALDILFDVCRKHGFVANIIGETPYLHSIRPNAPANTRFHGYVTDKQKINSIFKRCFCGYAVYRKNGPESYSYFGIPSKSFAYFASDVPVVTSDTAHFSKEIERHHIGRLIDPTDDIIEEAVLDLKSNYAQYRENIKKFRNSQNALVESFIEERISGLLESS